MKNLLHKALTFFKENKILALFIVAVLVGSGLSYSKVYFFHLMSVVMLGYTVIHKKFPQNFKNFIFIFPLLLLLWMGVGLLWTPDFTMGLKYVAFYSFGLLIIYLLYCNISEQNQLEGVLDLLTLFYFLVLVMGLLEFLMPFRWPISRLSNYVEYFGKEKFLTAEILRKNDLNYLFSMPTAFFWNPNDFALFITLFFPMVSVRIHNNYFRFILSVAVLILIIAAGARVCFYVFMIGLLLMFLFKALKASLPFVLLLLVMLVLAVNPITERPENTFLYRCQELSLMQKQNEDKSVKNRTQLLSKGESMIQQDQNLLLGAGPNGVSALLHKNTSSTLFDLHFFWLDLLINCGLIAFLAICIWYFMLLFSLFKEESGKYKTIGISLILLIPGAISVSSLIYFLPFYFLLALAMIAINLKS